VFSREGGRESRYQSTAPKKRREVQDAGDAIAVNGRKSKNKREKECDSLRLKSPGYGKKGGESRSGACLRGPNPRFLTPARGEKKFREGRDGLQRSVTNKASDSRRSGISNSSEVVRLRRKKLQRKGRQK